ncbi:MAG: CcmD family protein [Acidobacteriota bacterium]
MMDARTIAGWTAVLVLACSAGAVFAQRQAPPGTDARLSARYELTAHGRAAGVPGVDGLRNTRQGPGQDEFVPASQLPAVEQMPAAPMVIAAYAFVWVALLVYVWSIWRRVLRVERDLADLDRRVSAQQE